MQTIPRDRAPDASLSLWREGYEFLGNRRRRLGSDVFRTRLLGRKTICIHGPDAVRLIYDAEHFQRQGAVPARVLKTLMGTDGVQTLDDHAHQVRKDMFMGLMTHERIDELVGKFVTAWEHAMLGWEDASEIELFHEASLILTRAACVWTGVSIEEHDVRPRARQLRATIDGFGGVGPRYWRGRRARRLLESWLSHLVMHVRSGRFAAPRESPISVIARHRDNDGELLHPRTAAIELLNLIRPIVAIATPITFAAVALHEHPEWRSRLRADETALTPFVHEVRRYFPFTPAVGAEVRAPFEWHGYPFMRGTRVLVDVFGLHHDPAYWPNPEVFDPQRFVDRSIGAHDFVPQGGGGFEGHRCAGEWITITILRSAVRMLVSGMDYDVPPQDLTIDLSRIPTRPRSGVRLTAVRLSPKGISPGLAERPKWNGRRLIAGTEISQPKR